MICFDTSPIIWAVQGASGESTPLAIRAILYVQSLQNRGIPILLPAPAVSEYLRKIPSEQHERHLRVIRRSFRVAPFDGPAISIAAQLEADRGRIKSIRDTYFISRDSLSVDAQICAIAIASHADAIITHNTKHFSALAGDRIQVCQVPITEHQGQLFETPRPLAQ